MADRDNDTVQLTDLEVIQQFSLAVRGATATRREVIDALEADLAFLTSTRSATKASPAAAEPAAKAPAKKATPAKKAPAKKATRASRG